MNWLAFLLLVRTVFGADNNPDENPGVNDTNLFEGDMILTPKQRWKAEHEIDVDSSSDRKKRGSSPLRLWPDGIVVYAIQPSLAGNSRAMAAIRAGMDEWITKTCIRFKQRTNEPSYVYFQYGNGCSSYVGRTGSPQAITLAGGCWTRGIVAHEIGHALGFYHEQSRPDRDTYVRIIWGNIPTNRRNNFHKYGRSTIDSLGTPYDYGSIMHYGSMAFGSGRVTIVPKQAGAVIGQRLGLSDTDAQQANLLYRGLCTVVPTLSPAQICSRYNNLTEFDREKDYRDPQLLGRCDGSLVKAWYRFTGAAGTQMPTQVVPTLQCGTHATGWLSGGHPSVAEGIVMRKACFNWDGNPCRWSVDTRVLNCGAFFVYELSPTPSCAWRYCGDDLIAPPFQGCNKYKTLTEADREKDYRDPALRGRCDRSLPKDWYRFTGDAGTQMPTQVVPTLQCGTHATGWLSGGHPTVAEGIVMRKVCFHWARNPCQWSIDTRVKNCGAFFVYELSPTPSCAWRYCGDDLIAPGCNKYKNLTEADREKDYRDPALRGRCDGSLVKAWYRFTGAAGTQMPTQAVPDKHCGTHATGWLSGGHPTVDEGIVMRKACFSWAGNPCRWSLNTRVKNCGAFFVYELSPTPSCAWRYCGDDLIAPPFLGCNKYKTLTEADREKDYRDPALRGRCDRSLPKDWYRFTGAAGTQMPTQVVPTLQCGTHATGWLSGGHPTVAEGIVIRKVCFHWAGNPCRWSIDTRVKNCGAFFVYELSPTPSCAWRYCSDNMIAGI